MHFMKFKSLKNTFGGTDLTIIDFDKLLGPLINRPN